VWARAFVYIYSYIHTYVYHIYTCIYVYVYIYILTYMYMYIYTYIHIYMLYWLYVVNILAFQKFWTVHDFAGQGHDQHHELNQTGLNYSP
jgi:hypothetical protein